MAEFKVLPDLDWVAKAKSTDTARPALCQIHIDEFSSMATDGHRMHMVVRSPDDGYTAGSWDLKQPGHRWTTPASMDWWKLFRDATANGDINTLSVNVDSIATLKAAAAYAKETRLVTDAIVSLPCTLPVAAYVNVNATYLLDVLAGRKHTSVLYYSTGSFKPLVIMAYGLDRIGMVMPLRLAGSNFSDNVVKPSRRFDLSEFTSPLYPRVPEVVLPGRRIKGPGGSSEKKKLRKKSDAS